MPAWAPIQDSPGQARSVNQVLEHIRKTTQPADYIFASFDYGFYFLAGRRNPTGIYFSIEHLTRYLFLRQEFLADLERNPPRVLLRRAGEPNDAANNPDWWHDYIAANFKQAFRNDMYVVYERRPQ
jgi:hypothetical protein